MKELNNKQSGLHFESKGTFITEREYLKDWSDLIIDESSIDSISNFHDLYGAEYNLDDDETYSTFTNSFYERINKNRKDGFTIDLNPSDLKKSKITLPNSNDKIDFEDCDFDTTDTILSGLDIEYSSTEFELDVGELDIYENDRLISYLDNDKTIIKTELTDTNFTVAEFIDYQVERFEGEVSKSQIVDALASRESLETQLQELKKLDEDSLDYELVDVERLRFRKFDDANNRKKLVTEQSIFAHVDIHSDKCGTLNFQLCTVNDKDSDADYYLVNLNPSDEDKITELSNDEYEKLRDIAGEFLTYKADLILDSEKLENRVESVYGVKLDNLKKEGDFTIATFSIPKHNTTFNFKVNIGSTFTIDNPSAFEDAVDTADNSSKPNDRDLMISLLNFVKTKAELDNKKLIENEKKLHQKKPSIGKNRQAGLRMQ
ncbi:hypothetical protein [Moritella viscosa]|uniref:Ribosome maturation factor rimP n=1 Tax=Moritella viscosa TaxID=80854 RepID=A0A1L0AZU5_9GAMM|nr:hypothetical protein [Moritella viscosa]SGY94856.1 Ribosome maturation factor rimP [Moritella viscosa]